MGVDITLSMGSSSLNIVIKMDRAIACGMASSISGACGTVSSCGGVTAEGIASCERDPPGGFPEVPTSAPGTDVVTTQAPDTDDDDDVVVDDSDRIGVVTGTTICGYDGDCYNTNNPGVYTTTHITPGENSTNTEDVTTQIVTESCPGDVTCRQVTQVAIEEGNTV